MQQAEEKSEAAIAARGPEAGREGERYVLPAQQAGPSTTRPALIAKKEAGQAAASQEANWSQQAPVAQQAGAARRQDERMRREETLKQQIRSQLVAYDVEPLLITLNYRAAATELDLDRTMNLNKAATATQEGAPPAQNAVPATNAAPAVDMKQSGK